MASRAYEGNFKAWFLATLPADWEGSSAAAEGERVVTAAELSAGTRLERLVSNGGLAYTMTTNTASQALVDLGKISHNVGTREVTGMQAVHEIDFPLSGDDMWNLYEYGKSGLVVVAPGGTPVDGDTLHGFQVECSEPQPSGTAQDTKQNFTALFAVQDWDLNMTYEDSSS